jgi:hypothetical protein
MAQDSETTRAKVKKRSISKPSGGNAQAHWKQDTPKQTPHRNAPLPNVPHARGPSGITGPKPHGNIAHSGGEALNQARHTPEHIQHQHLVKIARQVIQAHRNAPSHPSGDTKGDLDRAAGDYYRATSNTFRNNIEESRVAHLDYLKAMNDRENAKYSGSPGKLISGFIHMKGPVAETVAGASKLAGTVAPYVAAAGMPAITGTLAGVDKVFGTHTLKGAEKLATNAGKELVDLPANAVPSLYYAGSPLVAGAVSGDSKKLGKGGAESLKRLAEPYKNLYEHPGKTIMEHPLSTGLMVFGGAKALDRVAGRVEQQAVPGFKPRKPYALIEQKLPGTAAKNILIPRQGAAAYRIQKKMHGGARMSDTEINRRTDELHYLRMNQSRADAYQVIKDAKAKNPNLTDEELQKIGDEAKTASKEHWTDVAFSDMALRDKAGRLRTFHFTEGKGGADDAIRKWGQAIINQGRDAVMKDYRVEKANKNSRVITGAKGKDVQSLVPHKLTTGPKAGQYILVPKLAKDRWAQHTSYLHETVGSAIGQAVGGTFRRTVLPFSPKWLSNNYTEAGLRGGLNAVGPLSLKEGKHVFADLGPEQVKEWNQLVKSAGHGGLQRKLLQEAPKWEDKLAETKFEHLGEQITKFGQKSIPKNANKLYSAWTDFAFGTLNGHMENMAHDAMAGKVLRRNPLMSQKLLDATKKAMANPDGAGSVEARNVLLSMGRETDRMFGKYGKFGPDMRRWIATWTPFIPWTLNAVHFLTQHLPNDHPVVTSLIGSAHQASQEWRNKHGLGYFIDGALPPFLQGAVPGNNGSHWMIFTQGTPFSVAGDPTGNVAKGFNPLGSTILANLQGMDWKGTKFKNDNPGVRVEQAILSFLEGTTPIGYAANRIEGGSGSRSENAMNWLNPYHPITGKKPKSKSTSKDPFGSGSKKKSSDPFAPGTKRKNADPFAP